MQNLEERALTCPRCIEDAQRYKDIKPADAKRAYETHEIGCECMLCEWWLDELCDFAAHGPLDENFDPADGSDIPEDDNGAFQQ